MGHEERGKEVVGIMTQCITIASWMLAVVGVVIIIFSSWLIYKDIKSENEFISPLGAIACFGIAFGLVLTTYGIFPYLSLSCITIIP